MEFLAKSDTIKILSGSRIEVNNVSPNNPLTLD